MALNRARHPRERAHRMGRGNRNWIRKGPLVLSIQAITNPVLAPSWCSNGRQPIRTQSPLPLLPINILNYLCHKAWAFCQSPSSFLSSHCQGVYGSVYLCTVVFNVIIFRAWPWGQVRQRTLYIQGHVGVFLSSTPVQGSFPPLYSFDRPWLACCFWFRQLGSLLLYL